MFEINQRGWAFSLWGAPWRNATTRFTCTLYHRILDEDGRERAHHLLRYLVVALDALENDSEENL